MPVYYDLDTLPVFKRPVITIGTFDGVHAGHKEILTEVVRYAASCQGESILITFEPHPRKLIFPDQPLKLITTLNEKLELVQDVGIEHVIVVPFTTEFSKLSAAQYIQDFLVGRFHPYAVIIGYDHRFGHDRKGDFRLLEKYAIDYQYNVIEIPARLIDEATISSTKIRHLIEAGRVKEAADMLGRPFSLCGHVVEGKKLGRTIGFPTANIALSDTEQIIPKKGVYAVKVELEGKIFIGMLNIGVRPTVQGEGQLSIEVHILNFDDDLYGKEIKISFIIWIREEKKFENLILLVNQLQEDKRCVEKLFSS